MAEKLCPLLICSGTYLHPQQHLNHERDELCKKENCAWYLEDEGRCAIASLPNVLDWAVRIAVTKPYEGGEDDN